MKKLSYLALAGFSFLLTSIGAQAAQDITCWDGDCLQRGWTRTSLTDGSFTDFQCYRNGCKESGMIVGGTQNIAYYTQCKTGGCYSQGWYTFDRTTQKIIGETRCNTTKHRHENPLEALAAPVDTCLTNGWTTYTTTSTVPTYCIKGDCTHQGWVTVESNTNATGAYCKRGDCFTYGWIESN